MQDKQEQFENEILLECELYNKTTSDGYEFDVNMDNLSQYVTLDELYSEYGRDLEQEFREKLSIIVNFILSNLDKDEYKLATLRYSQNLNYREMNKITNIPITTLQYRVQKLDKKLKSFLNFSNL
jgi:DNA-directed RNA polymerase specialized sigma24 family protein